MARDTAVGVIQAPKQRRRVIEHFWLSEAQIERPRPHLSDKVRGGARVDDRLVTSGIFHVLKSCCRRVEAPAAYGPRKTLYNRWRR